MNTTEIKQNFSILKKIIDKHYNKSSKNNTITLNPIELNNFTGFGSFRLLQIPDSIQEILKDPTILEKYSFAKADQIHIFVDFFNYVSKVAGIKIAEQLKNNLSASVSTEFYTPSPVADLHVENIFRQFSEKINNSKQFFILEPSCGTGRYFSSIRKAYNKLYDEGVLKTSYDESIKTSKLIIHGIEPQQISAYIARLNHPEVLIHTSKFQDLDLSQNNIDLIVGNIPFSNNIVYCKEYLKEKLNLQQLFFRKSIDSLSQDGILSFITTSQFSDTNTNQQIRKDLSEKGQIYQLMRLPINLFEHTSVSSDIITIKKGPILNKTINNLFSSESILYTNDNFSPNFNLKINSFFQKNQEYIIGNPIEYSMHRGKTLGFKTSENPISTIEKKFNALNSSSSLFFLKEKSIKTKETTKIEYKEQTSLFNDVFTSQKEKDNVFTSKFLQENDITPNEILIYLEVPSVFKYNPNNNNYDLIKWENINKNDIIDYINLRNKYKLIFKTEKAREKYVRHCDFLKEYYSFCQKQNSYLRSYLTLYSIIFKHDIFYKDFCNLEKYDQKNHSYELSEILTNKLYFTEQLIEKFKTPKDALLYSLNQFNGINFRFLSIVYKKPISELEKLFTNQGYLFYNPINKRYEMKSNFISGKLFDKFDLFENFQKENFPKWFNEINIQSHLQLINENKNAWIPFEDINIQLGNYWLDPIFYQKFIIESLDLSSNTSLKVFKLNNSERWKLSLPEREKRNNTIRSFELRSQINNRLKKDGLGMFEFALNGIYGENFTYKNKDDKIKFDSKTHKRSSYIVAKIEQAWQSFLQNLPHNIKEKIERSYNYKYNNEVALNYDGSFLDIKVAGPHKPRKHQLDSIFQIIQKDGAILDQVAGSGKTMIMIIAAMKMKELGLKKKSLIAALPANVEDIYFEAIKMYPNAKILFENPKTNETDKFKYLSKIKENDWDLIIMKHTTLECLPINPKLASEFLNDELFKVKQDFEILNSKSDTKINSWGVSGLRKKIENLEEKIKIQQELINSNSLETIYNIDSLGIDHIFIDESHKFKNIGLNTMHTTVKGLGSRESSNRALALRMQIYSLQNKLGRDGAVTLASGTTISNSIVELYNVLELRCPNLLRSKNIFTFDSFAKLFAEKSIEYELSVSGKYESKERFRKFSNIPELLKIYRQESNVVTDENFNVERPKMQLHFEKIPATEEQIQLNNEIMRFAETGDSSVFSDISMNYTEQQTKAKMLICTNLSKKASIDMRLTSDEFSIDHGSKLFQLCKNVAKHHSHFSEDKGTQIIFSDLGVPKYDGSFDIYSSIKEILVTEFNIPKDEIAFIHDVKTSKKKKLALHENVRKGNVRIIIGSTEKLGTGTNIQDRITAIHHIDIPWKPSDIEQRTKRGIRQGNWLAKTKNNNIVDVYFYATDKSLDAFNYQVVNNKQIFITQLKNNAVEQRSFSEVDVDSDSGALSYDLFSAALQGDTTMIDKIKKEQKLEKLTYQFRSFTNDKNKLRSQLEATELNLVRTTKILSRIEDLIIDTQFFKTYFKTKKKKDHPLNIEIFNSQSNTFEFVPKENISKNILENYTKFEKSNLIEKRVPLYRINQFTLYLEKERILRLGELDSIYTKVSIKDDKRNYIYKRNSNIIPKTNPELVIADTLHKSIKSKEPSLEQSEMLKRNIKRITSDLESLTFPKDKLELMEQLKIDINKLEKQISIKQQNDPSSLKIKSKFN